MNLDPGHQKKSNQKIMRKKKQGSSGLRPPCQDPSLPAQIRVHGAPMIEICVWCRRQPSVEKASHSEQAGDAGVDVCSSATWYRRGVGDSLLVVDGTFASVASPPGKFLLGNTWTARIIPYLFIWQGLMARRPAH